MSNTNIYEAQETTDNKEDVIEVSSEVLSSEPQPLTLEQKIDLIGEQLNWLCENLAVVFNLTAAMSANGGGVRGLMKIMKEMNNNGSA